MCGVLSVASSNCLHRRCVGFFLMMFLLHMTAKPPSYWPELTTDAEEPNTTGTVCKRRGMPVTCVCGFGFLCNCVGCRAWAPFSAVVQSQPSSASQGRRPAALHVRGDKAGVGAATGGDKPPRTKISPGPSEGADSGGCFWGGRRALERRGQRRGRGAVTGAVEAETSAPLK